MRTILHIDMDAFFASVEQRDRPELRGLPVLVGGVSMRSVVAAASYEARKYGVFSAMPMAEARRRCPQAIVVSPSRGRYSEASAEVFDVFRHYTPEVEGLSVDEAFLDVTASRSLFGDGREIAQKIKDDIFQKTALTASAGVARSKFVAKIASDMHKPNGLTVAPANVEEFLAPLPIGRMWGVGPKTASVLTKYGYRTFRDLAHAEESTIERLLGKGAVRMIELARGIDERPVVSDREAKSIGAEVTYETDLVDRESIEKTLLEHSLRCAERLTSARLEARTVSIKIKFADFSLISRSQTVEQPLADTDSIYNVAKDLLKKVHLEGGRVRLSGVSVSELRPSGSSLLLFPDQKKKKMEKLEGVLSDMKSRFGQKTITRAMLLDSDESDPNDP